MTQDNGHTAGLIAQAYIDGFMGSAEGYNGEYPFDGEPDDTIKQRAEEYAQAILSAKGGPTAGFLGVRPIMTQQTPSSPFSSPPLWSRRMGEMNSLAHSASQNTQPGAAKNVADLPKPGETFSVGYPFVRDTFYTHDEEGSYEAPTWRPGVRYEPDGPESVSAVADGEGVMRLTVVDTFKPGRYPTRVFVTRRFVRPDGAEFGKGKLHIWTVEKFRRLTRGYAQPYELAEDTDDEKARTAANNTLAGYEGEAGVNP